MGTQESGHEGEAAVQPENPVHSSCWKGHRDWNASHRLSYRGYHSMTVKYVDEEVVEQEDVKKVLRNPEIYQTIDGVEVGEPTIVSVRLRCHNLESFAVVASL